MVPGAKYTASMGYIWTNAMRSGWTLVRHRQDRIGNPHVDETAFCRMCQYIRW